MNSKIQHNIIENITLLFNYKKLEKEILVTHLLKRKRQTTEFGKAVDNITGIIFPVT